MNLYFLHRLNNVETKLIVETFPFSVLNSNLTLNFYTGTGGMRDSLEGSGAKKVKLNLTKK